MGRGMNFTWTDGPLILSAITTSVVVLRYCNRAAGDHSSIAVGVIQTELEINPVLEKAYLLIRQNIEERGEAQATHEKRCIPLSTTTKNGVQILWRNPNKSRTSPFLG